MEAAEHAQHEEAAQLMAATVEAVGKATALLQVRPPCTRTVE